MSPIRRGHEKKTRHDVEAFLEETYPGADAETRLHALLCWVYHAPLFACRGSREAVSSKAEAKGVTPAEFSQIITGDLTGIGWWALEAVLISCGAMKADIEVALALYEQITRPAGSLGPALGTDAAEDWRPLRPTPPCLLY
ncbi:hypothetical protein, partial [Actinomadura rubrisoli]